jgi:hypothetical protein
VSKHQATILVLGILILSGALFYYRPNTSTSDNYPRDADRIESFDECVATGYPLMESYPRQCRADTQTFVENIGNELEMIDVINIENPRPNEVIAGTVEVIGQARGSWFFEGSFSLILYNNQQQEIKRTSAFADGDWMTDEFVKFSANLEFTAPESKEGSIVLSKSNPSGLPENDQSLIVPIKFR